MVVTKYDHVKGDIPGVACYEAGHPVPDENSFSATGRALELVKGLTADDTVLFLLSGGELQDVTKQLLACAPARVFSIVLSDILGDPLDMIASGPAYPDSSTREQAKAIVEKYGLKFSSEALALLGQDPPKTLDNVTIQIAGSVRELCAAAAKVCESLGYKPILLTDQLDCEAREAGRFLADPPTPQGGMWMGRHIMP